MRRRISLRIVLAATLGLGVALGLGWAAMRGGSVHQISIDAVTAGGGAAAAAHYRQVDAALGQECVCGPAASASFQMHAGIVQPWRIVRNASQRWDDYR